MQNEHIDLPINIQETPEYLLEKAEPYKPALDANDAANEILKSLETLIKGNQHDLHVFYETALPAVQKTHFSGEKVWPTPSALEELFDTEYKYGAQVIYQEFSTRQRWNTAKSIKDEAEYYDFIDISWENYSSIFQRESSRINFSPGMAWDFFENFLRVYTFHQTRYPTLSNKQEYCDQYNPEKTKQILRKLGESIPNIIPTNPSTLQYFGYYALVAHSLILAHEKNYRESINIIKRVSLKETLIFSKACGSLLALFFNASFCHFMLEEYHKSVKLLETVAPFYQKNRKYFSKSQISFENLQRIYEKIGALLCIDYIFLEEKPKASVMDSFKNLNIRMKESREKVSDCFYKMKQQDKNTFLRLFNFVSSEFHIEDIQETVLSRFKGLESVTLNTIIQNYKRIQLPKIARMLKISQEQILQRLRNISAVEESQSAWDITILNPLLRQKKKINVEIQQNIATFDSETCDQSDSTREWERYRDEFTWLAEKVKSI